MKKIKQLIKTHCPLLFNFLRFLISILFTAMLPIKRKYQGYYALIVKCHAISVDDIQINDWLMETLTYENLRQLRHITDRDRYNRFLDRIISANTQRIKFKSNIIVAFILTNAAMWCGDELYNVFSRDKRFCPIVFLCCRTSIANQPLMRADFEKSLSQFRQRGIRVYPVVQEGQTVSLPMNPDICIYLTQYEKVLPSCLSLNGLTVSHLICHIFYGIATYYSSSLYFDPFNRYDIPLRQVIWMDFSESVPQFKFLQKYCWRNRDNFVYTGYPRMDTFYDGDVSTYAWNCVTQNAMKIIWAPHYSIGEGNDTVASYYGTFQRNYHFFLDYAKSHQGTTSWILKPHPNLLYSAIQAGLFTSEEEFAAYLQEWDSLPNAKVVTGGYYQDIFKTSDAMILDSASFIAEYQYTHKPMLFLTREGESFNPLGRQILGVAYTADGKDYEGIQHFIEEVVIGGKDPRREEREKVFRELLDYKADTGMLASENIYRHIVDALF